MIDSLFCFLCSLESFNPIEIVSRRCSSVDFNGGSDFNTSNNLLTLFNFLWSVFNSMPSIRTRSDGTSFLSRSFFIALLRKMYLIGAFKMRIFLFPMNEANEQLLSKKIQNCGLFLIHRDRYLPKQWTNADNFSTNR